MRLSESHLHPVPRAVLALGLGAGLAGVGVELLQLKVPAKWLALTASQTGIGALTRLGLALVFVSYTLRYLPPWRSVPVPDAFGRLPPPERRDPAGAGARQSPQAPLSPMATPLLDLPPYRLAYISDQKMAAWQCALALRAARGQSPMAQDTTSQTQRRARPLLLALSLTSLALVLVAQIAAVPVPVPVPAPWIAAQPAALATGIAFLSGPVGLGLAALALSLLGLARARQGQGVADRQQARPPQQTRRPPRSEGH